MPHKINKTSYFCFKYFNKMLKYLITISFWRAFTMEKLQYDSFYKFLVSFGAILITAPLVALYYLINIGNSILIENDKYSTLAPSSQDILNKREMIVDFILQYYPYFFGILIIIGFVLLFYGGRKWFVLQKEFDKQIKLKTKEQQETVRKMTLQEVLIKANDDMNDIQNRKIPASSEGTTQNKMLFEAIRLENYYFRALEQQLSKQYKVQQNVKINHMEYDIIAESKFYNIDKIYELKYWSKIPSTTALQHVINDLERRGISYENTMRRNFESYLIIITSTDNVIKMNGFIFKHTQKMEKRNKIKIKVCSIHDVEKGDIL